MLIPLFDFCWRGKYPLANYYGTMALGHIARSAQKYILLHSNCNELSALVP